MTVHGSLQCPYYVHTALKRGLGDRRPPGTRRPGRDRRRVRRQGGVPVGHRAPRGAAGRARRSRPVRMIYDRHEDIAATTKRHPAIVRHRTGVTRDGRLARPGHRGRDGRRRVLHADAGRPVARRDPRRRPVPLPERAHPRPGDADQHAAQRRVPRVRGAADRVRGRDPPQPDRRGARDLARSRSGGATSTGLGDTTPTGQVLRDERGRRGGPRARRRGRRVRAPAGARPTRERGRRAGSGHDPGLAAADRARADGQRHRAGARLARRRVHRLGRGQARLGRVARADRRRRDPAS